MNARDEDGVTPLLAATFNGHTDAAAALLQGGADPDARHHDGSTPLCEAASGGHGAIVTLLLDHGAGKRK